MNKHYQTSIAYLSVLEELSQASQEHDTATSSASEPGMADMARARTLLLEALDLDEDGHQV